MRLHAIINETTVMLSSTDCCNDIKNVFKPFFSDSDSEDESGINVKISKRDLGEKNKMTNSPVSVPVDTLPGPSHLLEDQQINQLVEMFPDCSREHLATYLTVHGTVSRAALSLSTTCTSVNDREDSDSDLAEPVFLPRDSDVSLPSLLEELKNKMSIEREKLKVDEEDLLNDAMAYYKNPNFNPKKQLRVIFNNQPAADIGGVSRQFFTQLLYLMSEEFFQGDNYKLPTYSSHVVASGIMKLVGTVIVHSILQGGPGLTIFSPSVYHYLATGDVDGAIQKMSVNDCSLRIKSYISMVSAKHLSLSFTRAVVCFRCNQVH